MSGKAKVVIPTGPKSGKDVTDKVDLKASIPPVEAKEEKAKVPKGYIVAEEGEYVATKKCTYGIALYDEGKIYFATDGELIPHHFKKK